MSDNGTIDITNLVEQMKIGFILGGKDAILATIYLIPGGAAFCNFPLVKIVLDFFLDKIMTLLANWSYMKAFMTNTAIRKYSQSSDYVNAVYTLNNLSQTVSDEEYKKAEQKVLETFKNFVMVSN